ncbi:MAG: IS3 family transposase [Subdoligranulum sp.]|nr:IS3 family transposase [Subdoligranulum sp.]
MPTAYTTAFKKKVIQRYEKGASIKSLSEELNVAQSTIYSWKKKFCTIQTPNRTYTPKEFDAVCRRLEKLEHEMEIIRLTGYLDKIPLQKKLASLEELYRKNEHQYSVHELCEALGVARGTFYNHILRRADRSKQDEEQTQLMLQVRQIFDDSEQRYGAEKIRVKLSENGINVSKKRIAAIMQELELYSVRSDAKKQFQRKQQAKKQNLLKQEFLAEAPNQIWVSDITYFKVKNYYVYLCMILDLYSRKIVGWRVSRHMSTNLATTTFKHAFKDRGMPQNLIFHSDRGSQYSSNTFINLLQQYNVKQSFSRTARPHDNAVAETFFATFKREEAYRKDYTSEQHFRKSVEQYILFYNETRPHQTLNFQTPQAFEEIFTARFIENTCSNSDPE